ncbi:hypothetical protein CEXT_580481 [Caerostris extrusa]|uniref:Uncharacterized protein n=1 Tax=Caerostris extrusa TaxID=172846 RepID=A0AAV4U130_CAEEX|nr:hypothetical protein CEXT_580481 [Caerostris extrusa]
MSGKCKKVLYGKRSPTMVAQKNCVYELITVICGGSEKFNHVENSVRAPFKPVVREGVVMEMSFHSR